MATATAMYHTGQNPLRKRAARQGGETVLDPARGRRRAGCTRPSSATTIPANWPLLRAALRRMGRGDLIGNRPHQLIPLRQPAAAERGRPAGRPFRTQHTGLRR